MSRLLILCILLFNFIPTGITVAQTVDPCQYGCPKEGCPQCGGGGGPIENGDEDDDNDSEDDSNDDPDNDGSDKDNSGDLPA